MVRTRHLQRATIAVFATLAISPLGAQEPAGRVFSPRINPANPNLIAFERLVQDRRELQVRLQSSGAEFAMSPTTAASAATFRLDELNSSERLAAYTGDLDWRPTSTDFRYWYAFVGSDAGRLNLFVNYVDVNGKVGLSSPLRVPNGVGARSPRWSPDGRHLAFVSDSGALYVVPEIDAALNGQSSASRMKPARVLATRGSVLFPDWSPVGNYLAYQVGKTGGDRGYGIEIVPVDARGVVGVPMAVGEGTEGNSKFRPSWSPKDGRYIAYYMDRVGDERATSELFDIGVTEVQTDPTGKRIFRSEVKRGRSPRLAEGVIPSATRGPTWTRIGGAGDAPPEPAVMYVVKDEARNNPIMAASVQSWIAQKSRQEYSATMSTKWSTVNHNDVSSVDMLAKSRYAYISVQGGGERVNVQDSESPWATGNQPVTERAVVVAAVPAPTKVATPVVPPAAVKPVVNVSSVDKRAPWIFYVVPGLPQLYEGRTGIGLLFLAAGAAGAGYGLPPGINKLTDPTPVKAVNRRTPFYTGLAIGSTALLAGIIEGSLHSPTTRTASLDVTPSALPDGSLVTRVGLRLALPRNSR